MRVGVFGGSFDPVHNGHLKVAEVCLKEAHLDSVRFVPAATQPLKPSGPIASDADRLRMLALALGKQPEFKISEIEIERGGVSYTVETLQQLTGERPGDELFLILGADALGDLANWREPREVCNLATLLVVNRPGATLTSPLKSANAILIPMEPIEVSSSEIRSRLGRGESIDGLVPPDVAAYIAQRQVYQNP